AGRPRPNTGRPAPPGSATPPADVGNAPGASVQIYIQERATTANVTATVAKVQGESKAVIDAVQRAGVPAASIRITGFNIGAGCCYAVPAVAGAADGSGGVATAGTTDPTKPAIAPPDASGAGGGAAPSIAPVPPGVSGYVVSESIQADTQNPDQMAAVVQAAASMAGVTSVNTFLKGAGNGPAPSGDTLAPAIRQATEQA